MDLDLHLASYLYQTPSKFYIQPLNEPKEALIIDRQTCEITVNKIFSKDYLPNNVASSIIDGIIGIKRLISGVYLIVISQSSLVGVINGKPIYKVEQTNIIPFNENRYESGSGQNQWETTYLAMLESVLRTPSFYYSYGYDLTNSLQRNYGQMKDCQSRAINYVGHQHYDRRFLWNQHLMIDFDRCGSIADRYRLPFILGFVSIKENLLGPNLNWALISRRGTRRAGTRFNSRGADFEGNVSNFVETEQLVECDKLKASHVQIRGSIPLLWGQRVNYRMKPPIEINSHDEQCLPLRRHIEELKKIYGDVSFVSLIDQRGHEGQIAYDYNHKMSRVQQYFHVPYHHFDFHKECSKMRWHRLNILINKIQPEIECQGYFAVRHDHVINSQKGIIRSNCIDSLDRTNVVQSMIAKEVLEVQINLLNNGISDSNVMLNQNFLYAFKNTWADNADALSIQYAGTPALKTDFTRTGHRTHYGAVMDGINSLTRYVANNFFDDYRQDAIDLFLGNFEGHPSPLYKPLSIISYTSLVPAALILFTLVALYLYLRQ